MIIIHRQHPRRFQYSREQHQNNSNSNLTAVIDSVINRINENNKMSPDRL